MTTALAKVMQELESSRQEKAVWEHVHEFLREFVDVEARPATAKMVGEDCHARSVPQCRIRQVMDFIQESHIEKLRMAISAIENLPVAQDRTDDDQKERDSKEEGAGKKAIGAGGKVPGNTRGKKIPRVSPRKIGKS